VFGVLLGGVVSWSAYHVFRDHTTYAPGFSRKSFALVRPGLPESRVLSLIGRPLAEERGPFGETWYYSLLPSLDRARHNSRGLIVTFRLDRTVAALMGNPASANRVGIPIGASAEDVLRTAGRPSRIEPPYWKKAWYSQQRGNAGRYSVFAVLYNANGAVVGTEARWDFD
jgi:outer membrane protein assembly factor BamE (lipoprotein component of BamABCDE complex)